MAVDRAAVFLTAHEITAHPAVIDVTGPIFEGDGAWLEFKLDLGFGARWIAEGASPTGVMPREPVRLDFRPTFPRSAPGPSLRPDFSRNHPHIQPYLSQGGRPVPCLVDGSLDEFVAAQGAYRMIDQFVLWLRNAAEGLLIDPDQGWEAMRRDSAGDDLICDPDRLRAAVTPSGGYKPFELHYAWRRTTEEREGFFIGQFFKATTVRAASGGQHIADKKGGVLQGAGLGFVVWAGRAPSGGPAVSDEYAPDDVKDLATLKVRATALHMIDGLSAVLGLVARFDHARGQIFPIPIVLAVRRPFKLKDSDSDIELMAYLVSAKASKLGLGNPEVIPLSLHDEITAALLQRLTDAPPGSSWSLLGCGSLGSKIALHRARDGAAPLACADTRVILPHNAARHALYPIAANGFGWHGAKASVLADVIEGLGQITVPIPGDQRALATALARTKATDWLVNTTASTITREDLASGFAADVPRVVEACLFDQGNLGYFGVEGPGHNPDGVELMAELYAAAHRDPSLAIHLFPEGGQLATVNIGQGCGSLTMKVSDAKISVLAGAMAEALADLSPNSGEGRVDLWSRDGFSLTHRRLEIPAWRRLPLEGLDGWQLSISPRALAEIEAEVARHKRVETGGVLVGFHSSVARRVYVTDVFPAPPDSRRRPHEFVLGVEGLADARRRLAEDTRGALTFAGTWHSHLGAATPSDLDHRSAAAVGAGELQPKAFLISGVNGLRAISAAAQGFEEAV